MQDNKTKRNKVQQKSKCLTKNEPGKPENNNLKAQLQGWHIDKVQNLYKQDPGEKNQSGAGNQQGAEHKRI